MINDVYEFDENDLEDFQAFEELYGLGDDGDDEPKELDFYNSGKAEDFFEREEEI